MFNVPRLPQDELVFRTGFSVFGSKALLRPELKDMLWMRKIIRKFTLPGGLDTDCCAGAFSVAKACTLLPQQRQFVGCDLESKSVASSLPYLAFIFARQVLYKDSDTIGDDDVQQTASPFVKAIAELHQKRHNDVWETTAGFPIKQTFLLHILHHLSTYHIEFFL